MKKYKQKIIIVGTVFLLGLLIGCVSYAPGEAPSDLIINKKWQIIDGVIKANEKDQEGTPHLELSEDGVVYAFVFEA